jgi:hypothetical protein
MKTYWHSGPCGPSGHCGQEAQGAQDAQLAKRNDQPSDLGRHDRVMAAVRDFIARAKTRRERR